MVKFPGVAWVLEVVENLGGIHVAIVAARTRVGMGSAARLEENFAGTRAFSNLARFQDTRIGL